MTDLLVAPCSRVAAERAVKQWHYSGTLPSGKLVLHGVWEDGRFIGMVAYGRGTNRHAGDPFGLTAAQNCELVRVALRDHASPVTKIVAASVRRLRQTSPGIRLLVSYADPRHGHHGGIYQAGNWTYVGTAAFQDDFMLHGRYRHNRSINAWTSHARKTGRFLEGESRIEFLRRTVDPNASLVRSIPKHKYVLPLDRAMRRLVAPFAKPYPEPLARPAVEAS